MTGKSTQTFGATSIKDPSGSMTLSYIVSLSVIAMLAILVHIMLDKIIEVQSNTGEIVNKSGQQRMLSQRVTLFTLDYVNNQNPDSKLIAESALDTMERNHRFLIGPHLEALDSDIASPMSDQLKQLYFESPNSVDVQTIKFRTLAEEVLTSEATDTGNLQTQESLSQMLAMTKTTLLVAFDAVVQQYEIESLEKVEGLRKAQLIVLGIIIFTIAAEAFFVFRPMVKRVREFVRRLQHDADHDYLTGLLNRRAFFLMADQTKSLSIRNERSFSILHADLDHFKQINDTYGHDVGDRVLIHTAHIMKKHFRKSDVVARFGGEEFVILMPETDAHSAKSASDKLRKTLNSTPIEVQEGVLNVKLCFGIASSRKDLTDINQLIANADKALFEAKSTGRNRSIIHNG